LGLLFFCSFSFPFSRFWLPRWQSEHQRVHDVLQMHQRLAHETNR
jgi:hypothetical protein